MFLKKLIISTETKTIREISFREGINLIVDNTGSEITGNNVGKTTVLKLIDFCLGASPKGIWIDPENKKDEYLLVKNFLKDNGVLITLILKDDLAVPRSREVKIERNFLARKEIIRRINGQSFTEEEFETELGKLIFPNLVTNKPTFRQLISHNIRYKDENLVNTLRTLDKFSTDAEYETLHLFMLGVEFAEGSSKQNVLAKLKQEETFKSRLEKNQTKNAYETALALVISDIEKINEQKSKLNLNEEYEADLDKLTKIKYELNAASSQLTNLNLKKELINEAQNDLKANYSSADVTELQSIYQQATQYIEVIQKTFDDLVDFHNKMIDEKVKFLSDELPSIETDISKKVAQINRLLAREKELSQTIAKSDSFEELEKLIGQLSEKYQKKGEYETIISQLNEVQSEIGKLSEELQKIDDSLFSDNFEQKVKEQLNKFNKFFASVSEYLYDEQYALKHEIITNRKGQKLYKFTAFNLNFSSGKKQGEISCFDIAYIMFADSENMPCLHFILNDKKELMHDNQLVKISEFVNLNKIQFVASMLRDKLPAELNNTEYFVLELSQSDKLFRIENNG
jgi:uncharacterized protein YydD (DUF2326 family)